MKKVLVIDDDDLCRQMIVLALEQEGYDLLEATDGEDGIRIARLYLPDLIICDMVMDNIDGLATLTTLRHERTTSSIPFILMTGKADPYIRREGMEMGADGFLAKPFHISELLTTVNSRLRKDEKVGQPRFTFEHELAAFHEAPLNLALPTELRNPLNLILGFAETMQNDHATLAPEEIAEMAGAIRESTLRLERSIGNALIFSRLEHLADNKSREQWTEQLPSVEKIVQPIARYKAEQVGRTKDLELNLRDLPVAVPKEHLTKIVDELLDNAFRYSPSGTPVKAVAMADHEDIFISVSDHGKGITAQQLESLGAVTADGEIEHKNSGYGLAIVKKLAEMHGGGFEVRSKAGSGTTVVVKLPGIADHKHAV